MRCCLKKYLEEIEIASEAIFDECYDARISIIRFTNSAKKVTFSNGEEWASNIVQVRELLSQLKHTPTCTQSNYGSAQSVMFNSTKFRDDAVRFGFSIFSLPSNRYTGGNKNAAKKLLEKDIKWGYVCRANMSPLDDMYMTIDYGTTLVYSSYSRSFGSDIADVVYNTTVDSVTPYIVLGCDLKKVKLVGPLSKNSSRDTDGDGLSDSQEINWDKYQMMTLYDFLRYTNQFGIFSNLSQEKQDEFRKTKIYPVYSNPTMADSDGDGGNDYEEIINYKTNPLMKNHFSYMKNYVPFNVHNTFDEIANVPVSCNSVITKDVQLIYAALADIAYEKGLREDWYGNRHMDGYYWVSQPFGESNATKGLEDGLFGLIYGIDGYPDEEKLVDEWLNEAMNRTGLHINWKRDLDDPYFSMAIGILIMHNNKDNFGKCTYLVFQDKNNAKARNAERWRKCAQNGSISDYDAQYRYYSDKKGTWKDVNQNIHVDEIYLDFE